MGCFFSKCRSSLILNKSGTMPPNTCVQRIDQTNTNGIARVPKLNLDKHDEALPLRNDRALLRMKPPPPAPPPSPPRQDTSPRPILTAPRSPVNQLSINQLQYAEDLRPVSIMTSDFPSSHKSHRESSVTVSDVRLNPTVLGLKRTSSTRRKDELSIEELDTDCEDDSKLSNSRYSASGRLNTPTTDILLPRRKDTTHESIHKHKPIPNNPPKSADSNRTTVVTTGNVTHRNDTPIPRHLYVKNKRNVKADSQKRVDIIREQTEGTKITADVLVTMADETRDSMEEMNVKQSISKNDTSGFIFSSNKIKIGETVRDAYTIQPLDEPVERTFLQFPTGSKSKFPGTPTESPKKLFDTEMERKRQKRKRKRGTNQRQEYIPGKLNDHDTSTLLMSALKDRPDSNTSRWTLDSKTSFGSNVTLNSFEMDVQDSPRADRYSYIQNNSTPISFKALAMDIDGGQAEIIDLEDDTDDVNNSSWLDDSKHETNRDKKIDGWYGVKPYEVHSSKSRSDSGILTAIEREPSSSELITKKKLLYSRFTRRPQSETLLRSLGKPPLPPGAGRKVRPVSDTGQRTPRNSSRYFTNDLDIH